MNEAPNQALPFRQAPGPERFDSAHRPEPAEGLAEGLRTRSGGSPSLGAFGASSRFLK